MTALNVAFLGGFLAVSLLLLRADAIATGERTVQDFAKVTADQTTRTLQATDQVLQSARSALAQSRAADPTQDPAVHAALRELLVNRPFLRSFWLLTPAGRIAFNSSDRYVGDDVSDRPFFVDRRDRPAEDFRIHLPVQSRGTGQWYMTATRAWHRPDGALGAIIVATPERRFFENAWNFDVSGRTSVSLFHEDGTLLMRSPYIESAMGRSPADSERFKELLAEGATGVYQAASSADRVERLHGYRRLETYPTLLVVVGRPLSDILASWSRHVWIAFVTWAVGSAVAFASVAWLARSQRGSEQKLESARATSQRLFETSVDLIVVTDRQGNLTQVSPSARAILGHDADTMVGRNAIDFIHHDDLERTRNEMRQGRLGKGIRRFDCRYVHSDGHPVLLAWAGVWSDTAEQHFFIGRDMTDHRAMEEQLRQAQKMEAVGQLTGGVAHDFNNLLTVIMGNADALVEALARQPDLRQLADMVSAAAVRGAELTSSLLAFARRQPLDPKVTDINRLLTGMERLIRRTLGEHVEIELRLATELWRSMIDAAQLESAVLNLVVNARDAMPSGGRLTVETANVELDDDYARQNPGAPPGFYVSVTVADSGTGMAPETIARAFEPFYTTKEVGKGSGLGLSMVYGFTKQSNGHVKIYSELGHGTTIKLYLPRSAQSTESAEPAAAVDVAGGKETILVVEDDDAVREYVERQIASLGYRVLSAVDGHDALAVLKKDGPIDLLFTDVVMPGGMNGPHLAREVRLVQPSVKVLFTSGYTENAIVHQGRLDANVELLSKPYRRRDLAAKLRKVLDA